MKKVKVSWSAWYDETEFEFEFPHKYYVEVAYMNDSPDVGDRAIEQAIKNPIQSDSLDQITKRKKTAAIAIDDISRPTPGYRILPILVRELVRSGIKHQNIKIILALGSHRPMVRRDIIRKLGKEIVDSIDIHNHHPYENLVNLGVSSRGTPIIINRLFVEADIKICIGCIIPHPGAGFGGGAKIILPGIAGIETLAANHELVNRGISGGINQVCNENRADIEEIGRKVGVDFTINVIPNSNCGVAGVFAGDMIASHRAGIEVARQVLSTKVTCIDMDFGVFNLYPKDTEFMQSGNAFNVCLTTDKKIIKDCGTLVVTTASPEGRGFHSLLGPGRRLAFKMDNSAHARKYVQGKRLLVFSPNLSESDVAFFSDKAILKKTWQDVIADITENHGDNCKGVVFPCSSIQLIS